VNNLAREPAALALDDDAAILVAKQINTATPTRIEFTEIMLIKWRYK
jgi:hypothetical protein